MHNVSWERGPGGAHLSLGQFTAEVLQLGLAFSQEHVAVDFVERTPCPNHWLQSMKPFVQ